VSERLSSGEARLDEVLGGGLPAAAITVVAGVPGTGKTMLAAQYAFHNGSPERPAVYFATTTEPLDKLVRFGQGLSFFDPARVGTAVLYDSLYPQLTEGGLPAVIERVVEVLRDARPSVVVFDSFRAFRAFSSDDLAHRQFVSELAGRLSATSASSIWVGEYEEDELAASIEGAIADAIIVLRTRHDAPRTLRQLRVDKTRGGSFLSGEHAYRLSADGLTVFPRLADPLDPDRAKPSTERISLGTDALDGLIDGGVWLGTATLVMGPAGAGKTMVGLDFLTAGAEAGRRGVFATLQESSTQLTRVLDGRPSRSFDGLVTIHRRSPVDVYVDEWVHDVLDVVASHGASQLVIDSLSDLRFAAPDETAFEEYVYSLGQRCARDGITLLMTLETRPPFAFAGALQSSLSHIVDNIIVLGYRVDGPDIRRVLAVLKSRGSDHDPQIHEFTIGADGIRIGGPISIDVGTAGLAGRPLASA
jgi:circadian clock protein KaiC